MKQRSIPFLLMRGGSSRAPFFRAEDLSENRDILSEILVAVIGAGHPINIDGIGGGVATTTKVAILSSSKNECADIDYLFAQVSVEDKLVDYKPTCGNILSAVAPAALEMGLIEAQGAQTKVRIRSLNTDMLASATIQTPNREPEYEGDTEISGVPGTAAKIILNFMNVTGSATGKLLPTGNRLDLIGGIEVTCMDVAMPMVIARATDFSLTGYESSSELDQNKKFFEKMEKIRIEAAIAMAMGDVRKSVIPKFALIAPAKKQGNIAARYFMPWATHPSMAVTGAQCIAASVLMKGTVADGLIERESLSKKDGQSLVAIEHPSGVMNVLLDCETRNAEFVINSAGIVRTARKIASGLVFVPAKIWDR